MSRGGSRPLGLGDYRVELEIDGKTVSSKRLRIRQL
jgi:hypothetical protein